MGTTGTAYVVRGADGDVVAVFWGADARAEAARWRQQGYEVERTNRATLEL